MCGSEVFFYQSTENQRIDKYLSDNFTYSRNFFHHIISRWWILVNWKKIKKSYKLQNQDKIEIDDLQRYISPLVLQEAPNIQIPIVYETDDYIVIDKPKWVLSHPNSIRDVQKPSVVGFLYYKYKNLPSVWNFIRAWLVHRLDKDTDWFMIIAKTEKWLTYFKSLFDQKSLAWSIEDKQKIKLKKRYKAICEVSKKWYEFLSKIKSQLPYFIQENVIPKTPKPVVKLWITKIIWIQSDISFWNTENLNLQKNSSKKLYWLDLEILTWRTHQIRYHLSQNWLPILNDYLYGTDSNPKWKLQLTAYCLEFEDCYWDHKIFKKDI